MKCIAMLPGYVNVGLVMGGEKFQLLHAEPKSKGITFSGGVTASTLSYRNDDV
jgi:hypothetical protein